MLGIYIDQCRDMSVHDIIIRACWTLVMQFYAHAPVQLNAARMLKARYVYTISRSQQMPTSYATSHKAIASGAIIIGDKG